MIPNPAFMCAVILEIVASREDIDKERPVASARMPI